MVYKLPKDPTLLRKFDEYEEYDDAAPEKSLFLRKLYPVDLATGRTLECWIYVYNRVPDSAPILEGGIYPNQ